MSQRELSELSRELEFRRRQIVKLEQELKDRDERLLDLELQHDRVKEADRQFQTTMERFETIVSDRVKQALELENRKNQKIISDLAAENEKLRQAEASTQIDRHHIEEKDAEIKFLHSKLLELAESSNMKESLKDLEKEKNYAETLRKELELASHHWTTLSRQMEDVLAENRVLREMAEVPENYGFDLNEIKLVEKQKIEEYRSRITRLEEEVEELEKERTQLRYKLRNLSTLYGEKGLRFHRLTAEQMRMVDEFAVGLREGRIQLPMNDRSKELMLEIEKLKAQIQILEANSFGRKINNGITDEILEEIRRENRELKDLLMKLFAGITPTSEEKQVIMRHGLQLPPVPISNSYGEFVEGFSYRFSSKMPVPEIWTGDPRRDMAAMQLQIIELLELISRKDEEEQILGAELDEFRSKLRGILLVQQELYKEYASDLEKWQEDRKHFESNYEQALQELREARSQISVFSDMMQTMQAGSLSAEKTKILELSTRTALLEVNLLRLSRKYECLQSEERDIRQAYHGFEAEHAEKDVVVLRYIGKLKEWRASATAQMQFLFRQLRNSIPLDKHEQIEHQLDLLKEKQADWVVREAYLYKRIAKLEDADRENFEIRDKMRRQDDDKIEVEGELDLVSRRLEALDPSFKLERAVFRRIVEHLQDRMISVGTAFSLFDKNKDGSLTREEFRSALNNIGVKLNPAELDSIIRSMDSDTDGGVNYREFIKKLKIYGAKEVSEEQQILNTVYENISKLGYSLLEVFQIFDRDNDGQISRQDLINSFSNFGLGINIAQIEKILRLVDSNKDGMIEFSEFNKVFESHLGLRPDQKTVNLDWKHELFAKIKISLDTLGLSMSDAFRSFDKNEDGKISKSELAEVLKKLKIELTKNQLEDLWSSMNSDGDDHISYVEFISQFKSSSRKAETQAIIEEASREVLSASGFSRDASRQALLEAREQAALLKAERYHARMRDLEDQLTESEKRVGLLEQKNFDILKKYQLVREAETAVKVRLINTVSKSESENLKQTNEKLKKELAEVRAAMNTYKSLVGVSSDQVRALKLTVERRKDELENYQIALRELESESQESATLGKLYHQVMISRWAEASANRKYDSLLNETRVLRNDSFKLETQVMENGKIISELQTVLTEKITNYESAIKELRLLAENNITVEKANEFVGQIREYGEKKSILEESNRKLRGEVIELEGKIEEAKIMRKIAEEIFQTVRTGSSDEISDKLVEMAERMSETRLSELKSRREAVQSKEKEEYLNRLHAQDLEAIRALEQDVSTWESMMAKKEEIWRKKDDERQKILLTSKLDTSLDSIPSKFPSAEIKKKDEDLKLLTEQLRQAENNLQIKNEQIEHLTKIRDSKEFSYIPERDKTESSQKIVETQKDIKTSQLAQIASNNIKTINDMLENKNNELKRKEEMINKLKKEIVTMQQEFSKEKLNWINEKDKMQTTAKELRTEASFSRTRPMTAASPELDTLIQEKDRQIENFKVLLKKADNNKISYEKRMKELKSELERALYDLNMEKNRQTEDRFRKDLDLHKKLLKVKDDELAKLKAALQNLKKDFLSGGN